MAALCAVVEALAGAFGGQSGTGHQELYQSQLRQYPDLPGAVVVGGLLFQLGLGKGFQLVCVGIQIGPAKLRGQQQAEHNQHQQQKTQHHTQALPVDFPEARMLPPVNQKHRQTACGRKHLRQSGPAHQTPPQQIQAGDRQGQELHELWFHHLKNVKLAENHAHSGQQGSKPDIQGASRKPGVDQPDHQRHAGTPGLKLSAPGQIVPAAMGQHQNQSRE